MPVLIGKEFLDRPKKNPSDSVEERWRILIIEDSPDDAELVERSLEKAGIKFTARIVDTFEGFVKELDNFKPSIILADYSLPAFTGSDMLKYINEHKIDIPFLLVTGSQSEEIAVQCINNGAEDYILKSNMVRLPAAVRNSLEKHRIEKEKIKTETKLIQYEELYESILQAQSEQGTGFIIVDGTTLQLLFVDKAFCTMSKYNVSELLRLKTIKDIISENSLLNFDEYIKKLDTANNSVTSFVAGLIRKDNRLINLEFTVKQFVKNDHPQYVMIIRNVTKKIKKEITQRLTQETLRESEKRYRTLIEDVKDYAIFILDTEGKIISWNAGAARIMGYKEKEILFKHFSIFLPEGRKKSSALILEKAKKEGRIEEEIRLNKKGKDKFWTSLTITAFFYESKELQHFSVIIRDLTKSKQAEELLRSSEIQLRALAVHLQATREEERTRIARELHDEFSQMLTALRMDLTILGKMISKTVSEPLNRISLLEKISSISDLLEMTIRSTRRIITELRPAVLDELGLQTAIQWQAQEFENRTDIRCKILRLQRDIVLDQNKTTAIFRILQEALTNVAKHASATKVTISLHMEDNNLILEIADNGKGIEERKLKDPTSAGVLGMRERALALDGHIEIVSEKDKGTKLTLVIPYNKDKI